MAEGSGPPPRGAARGESRRDIKVLGRRAPGSPLCVAYPDGVHAPTATSASSAACALRRLDRVHG